jgi:hypothetical protein
LQDINKYYKNSKKNYYHELISQSKNKTKTTWKVIKIEIGNNNCQNYTESLKIINTVTNNPQENANTFNGYFLTVAETVTGNIKKDNSD